MPTTTLYHAIADAHRRLILDMLRDDGPLQAGDIVARLPAISQPAVSKHLRILREANLVWAEPVGRMRRYHLNAEALRQVADWLSHYDALWDDRLRALKRLSERDEKGTRS
jgi:DNA-binding transcriptional ArsR family regulator